VVTNPERLPETPVPKLPPKPSRKRSIRLFRTAIVVVLIAFLLGWYLARLQGGHGTQIAAPQVHGWIHTDGTSLVDARGKPVILAGVDDSRLDAGEGNTPDSCHLMWSAASAADIANMRALGFNMDRIGISWANLEPTPPTVNPDGTLTHHWNMRYLAALDGEIKDLHANHMVAILDMHQSGWSPALAVNQKKQCEGHGLPRWLYTTAPYRPDPLADAQCQFFSDVEEPGVPEEPQEGLAAAWKMLARRYASDPTVVGADMFNEPDWPTSCYQASLRSFYDKIGDAIRSVNKHILLIYEDRPYSITPPTFLLGRKPALTNAVYSWHFYPANWTDGRAQLAAHLARARSWDVPLWIGEFDGFGGTDNFIGKTPPDPQWPADLGKLMTYFRRNHISWSIWDYDASGYSVVVPGTTQPKSQLMSLLRQDMQ
jgi:Cellulase (glycosyl hydrolase family 5)